MASSFFATFVFPAAFFYLTASALGVPATEMLDSLDFPLFGFDEPATSSLTPLRVLAPGIFAPLGISAGDGV